MEKSMNHGKPGASYARNPNEDWKRKPVDEFSSGSTKGVAPFTFTFASPVVCEGDAKVKAKGA